MDFPQQLVSLLEDKSDDISVNPGLIKICEDVETFFTAPPRIGSSNDVLQGDVLGVIKRASFMLLKGLITLVQGCTAVECGDIEKDTLKSTLAAKKNYLDNKEGIDRGALSCYVRAGKNLLRWYVQILLSQRAPSLPSPVSCLQNDGTIELLVCFLENQIEILDIANQEIERDISLFLFYATFSAFPGDEASEGALRHLIFGLSFTKTVLKFLMKPCSSALLVALIRNIHTAIVSLQGAGKEILNSKITCNKSSSQPAVWISDDTSEVSFSSICTDILQWALNSEPAFPGEAEDRRFDLVLEILGAFYALRIGQKLDGSESTKQLFQCILDILKLPEESEMDIVQCKTSAVSLLMDCSPVISEDLISNGCIASLLELMETQVQRIIEAVKVDDGAAASVVPVLIVLNKFSTANTDVRKAAKDFVFPSEAEEAFRQKVHEHERTSNKRNMGPLDAPKRSLRWNLISLLTWPQGHIKRCTGEVLWTLCSFNATEFVHRVGFGNGMPLLGAKGLVQMPQK
ncbi:MAG: hypothetical protein SGBAC_005473 [Bacillariaceae sp.]